MVDVNVQDGLKGYLNQVEKFVDEVNKINAVIQTQQAQRENLLQKVHNINGIIMWLRGKLPPEEQVEQNTPDPTEENKDFERSAEYPPDKKE